VNLVGTFEREKERKKRERDRETEAGTDRRGRGRGEERRGEERRKRHVEWVRRSLRKQETGNTRRRGEG
jgi:hypothetical protein